MKSLQFNINNEGFLILEDIETHALYYPSDSDMNFLNVSPQSYRLIEYVSDGYHLYPVNFITHEQLGWIGAAIGAVATIGGALVGKKTSKEANQSAERQLQTQQQIAMLQAQAAERQAAQAAQARGISTPALIGIAVVGSVVVGSIIYLVNASKSKEKEQANKERSKVPQSKPTDLRGSKKS